MFPRLGLGSANKLLGVCTRGKAPATSDFEWVAQVSLLTGCCRQHLGGLGRITYAVPTGPEHEQKAGDDGTQAGNLGVTHTPVNAGVDADELHEKAGHATQHQVFSGKLSNGQTAFRLRRSPP